MKPIDILTNGRHSDMIKLGICTTYGELVEKFRNEISMKEYKISGMCQECQDKIFGKEV